MIYVGIFGSHKMMIDCISAYVSAFSELKIVTATSSKDTLFDKLKQYTVHVLVVNMFEISTSEQNFIVDLKLKFPKLKIVLLTNANRSEDVIKSIKAGANGFITMGAGGEELIQAIYSLRSGHDYYDNSIAQILMNRRANDIDKGIDDDDDSADALSSRQVEILRLWGNGCSNQEIADKLFISIRTVETHKNHIMQKLNLKSTVDLIKFAIKNNIIKI